MKKQIIEMILLKVKNKPNLKKYLFLSAACIGVFGVLVIGVGLWLASLTFSYVSNNIAGVNVLPQVQEVGRKLALDEKVEVSGLLNKPLLSQGCMDSAIKLVNPTVVLTYPLSELWNDFKLNCIQRSSGAEEQNKSSNTGVSA